MNAFSSLPYHILDNICEHLTETEVIKLSHVDSKLYSYVYRLTRLRKKYESICIRKNRWHRVTNVEKLKSKKIPLVDDRFVQYISTSRFYYWESTILDDSVRTGNFLKNITVFSFQSQHIDAICKLMEKMQMLNEFEIMNPEIEESDVVKLVKSINFKKKVSFTFKLNISIALTEKIMEEYFSKCHKLPTRNLQYGVNKYPGKKPLRQPTLDGIAYFMTSTNLCTKKRGQAVLRGSLEVGMMDEESITKIVEALKTKLAGLEYFSAENPRVFPQHHKFRSDKHGDRVLSINGIRYDWSVRLWERIERLRKLI